MNNSQNPMNDEDDEIYLSQESSSAEPKNSLKLGTSSGTGGFQSIVKRIQLAARISQQGNQHGDCYDEDAKLNTYLKQTKLATRRRSRRSGSIFPLPTPLPTPLTGQLNTIQESPFEFQQTRPSFILGEIHFLHKDHQYDFKPFVALEPHITLNDLSRILLEEWQLEMPKIVTLIVTGKSQNSRWKNEKQIKNFQIGIAKAAMSTNMWILTNAVNGGVTSYVCSAIEREFQKAKLKGRLYQQVNSFHLIGIAHENHLIYGRKLCYIENALNLFNIENTGFNDGHRFELNPDHTNFIVLKNFLYNNDFIMKLIDLFNIKDCVNNHDQKQSEHTKSAKNSDENNADTPFVSILIDGEPENIQLVLQLIKKRIPVVVLQGSGGMADIVSYAYARIFDSFVDSIDKDYIDKNVKPLLDKKIIQQFNELEDENKNNERNRICQQVIECVCLTKQHRRQDGREYLILLDTYNINQGNLTNLREYLLNAILKSKHRNVDRPYGEQFSKDFDLIVDWNCATVARNALFSMNSVSLNGLLKSKFLGILTRQDREEFVELFLANGFQLHKFLTPSKLSRLFRMIHDDEFFHAVCWETVLSKSPVDRQSKFFIETDLNWLLEFGTGLQNLVKINELHLNASDFIEDSLVAERKALTLLTMWAVVQNRYELVEILWKYCDHPIHLALIISMFFDRLSWHVYDTNLKFELEQRSKTFAKYAYDVLDRCYQENISLAYNVLRESIKDFNYMTAVDIAANARLKQFLAHPCCQKWLANTFQGKIRIREITWGFFTVPVSIKILLCSLLVFPMYIWVRFKNDKPKDDDEEFSDDDDEEEELDDVYENNANKDGTYEMKQMSYANEAFVNDGETSKPSNMNQNITSDRKKKREVFVQKQPPLWKMIVMMWSAPISKFYTSLFFYVIFLMVISLAALYPNCGNIILDSIVCSWSLLIAISYIRHVYILFIRYSSVVTLYTKIIEILLILTFTGFFSTTRVLRIYFYPIYWQKIMIALAVLYFYYRLISVYLPISPTLGPFLYRFRLMITVDFVNYMRITTVILIANSIAIRSLQYPYEELTIDSIKSVFHQGIVSLFTGPPSGKILVTNDPKKQSEYCPNSFRSFDNSSIIIDYQDNQDTFIIYVFVFQFFIILKLILGPLLFSIFAVTASKWVSEIDSIWKFQRYQLVIDFANRLSIPEPFSIVYYLYILCYYIAYILCCCCYSRNWCKLFERIYQQRKRKKFTENENIISPEDCLYWKLLAGEYIVDQQRQLSRINENDELNHRQWDCIRDITEEIEYEKKLLREIKSKLFEMEKFIFQHSKNENIVTKNIDGNDIGSNQHLNVVIDDDDHGNKEMKSLPSSQPPSSPEIIIECL